MTAMRQQWTPGRKRLSLAIAAALTAGDDETMPVVPSEGGAQHEERCVGRDRERRQCGRAGVRTTWRSEGRGSFEETT
jgi:hypothetical protein